MMGGTPRLQAALLGLVPVASMPLSGMAEDALTMALLFVADLIAIGGICLLLRERRVHDDADDRAELERVLFAPSAALARWRSLQIR